MANKITLEEWICAGAEALADFSQETLGISINNSGLMEWQDKTLCQPFSGAAIELNHNEQTIKILFLSDEQALIKIAKLMLMISPEEKLLQEDMMDAIKEAVNIISGGIKSRMNEHVGGGLLLGLPYFSQKNIIPQKEEVLIGKIAIATMPLYLAVSAT